MDAGVASAMRRVSIALCVALGCGGSGGDGSAGGSSTSTISSTGDAATTTPPDPDLGAADTLLLRGATLAGAGPADVRIDGAQIVEVGALDPLPGESIVELQGMWLAPSFIDSHVHLVYRPTPGAMAQGGIAAAVDLAAPVSAFETDFAPLRVVLAGPMITAEMGYPTQSWGVGGYGLECADAAAAEAAVDALHELGAGAIKLAVTGAQQLDDAALAAASARAHAFDLRVVSHALADADAARAAAAGSDALAHTPTDALSPATLDAWSGRAVISTLRAFGGGQAAIDNLAALRERGATVLYGTLRHRLREHDDGGDRPRGARALARGGAGAGGGRRRRDLGARGLLGARRARRRRARQGGEPARAAFRPHAGPARPRRAGAGDAARGVAGRRRVSCPKGQPGRGRLVGVRRPA